MLLSAHSHMPIFSFILVDDEFMIQACKNNTSLTSELSAISKCVLVITHTYISRLFALRAGYRNISLFFLFLHGKNYILHPPTVAGIMQLRLTFENCILPFTCWIKCHCTNMRIKKRRQKGVVIVDNFIFFGKRKTESKEHLVIPSIPGAYSHVFVMGWLLK